MEATVLSVGKSVLDGALGYAQSAVAEEVALQLGIQRDHAFIRDELEMMQAFLRAAHDERDDHAVLMTWVKQVRDVAYDAEDCLQDFSIHLKKPSWWRVPRTLRERRRIAKQMKELRARVEDVSQRNLRYQLFKGPGSKPATAAEQSSITAAAIFGIDEARRAAKQDKSKADLVQLISKVDEDLGVIAVWGTSGDLGQTSIIRAAYENLDIKGKFPCRAWVRMTRPFNPRDFVESLVKQFDSAVGVDVLLEIDKTMEELSVEFNRYVNEKSYLIVLTDLSTIEEWDRVKICFPNNKKGSRIIVSTKEVEVASLCAGQEIQVSELNQLSADQTLYAFYEKDSQDRTKLPMPISSSTTASTSSNSSVVYTNESQLIGRKKEKSDIVKLLSNQLGQQFSVISVWGMGGLGKTALVKDVCQSENLTDMFEKRVFVTVTHPFILKELLKSLTMQLGADSSEKKGPIDLFGGGTRKVIAMMGVEELIVELARRLEGKKCLIVLDDLSSTAEWDLILRSFPKLGNTCQIIITTREESIAKHCSEKMENIYKLNVLEYNDALDLFTKKVFKDAIGLEQQPELIEEAKVVLKKCNGLPLAIVTIGGFLANQPKIAGEWRKLNEHISAELEVNPELGAIRTILGKSYDGLPYHLKSCFLYLSIFPEDHKVTRRRLMQRWTAEGYAREIRGKSAEEMADGYFMELINRSMILPSKESIYNRKKIDSCQIHDLMREISISKSAEENLVFRLEEGCSLNTQGTIRHLTINNNWKGDKSEFESAVDLSRIRSLTVFGKWRSFFISDRMRLLRVLDLEGTSGLANHHLEHIGKLVHLKYLSLKGCDSIFQLPDSLGNIKQLETLVFTDTHIFKLPKAITKLKKLQYVHGVSLASSEDDAYEIMEGLLKNKLCLLTIVSAICCVTSCVPQVLDDTMNTRDVCTLFCCIALPFLARHMDPSGFVVPRGIWKLKALHTLGVVYLAGEKDVMQEIKRLTRLRKLGVDGVNKKNSKELCSALADLSNLESLLLRSTGEPGLHGCLDGLFSPPKNLQSLKLYGHLVKLPEWIEGLQNLVKLTLRSSRILEHDAAMRVLSKLPNLTILRLLEKSFHSEELCLSFQGDEPFQSLTVLQLNGIDGLKSVEFIQGAMPLLELLQFGEGDRASTSISGLSSLPSLKELLLEGTYKGGSLEGLRKELARNPTKPVLKRD